MHTRQLSIVIVLYLGIAWLLLGKYRDYVRLDNEAFATRATLVPTQGMTSFHGSYAYKGINTINAYEKARAQS